MKTKMDFKHLPKTYEGLLRCHMFRPIHDRVGYENSIEILEALAGHNLTPDQDDYFEALSLLVEAYEADRFPMLKRKKGRLEECDFRKGVRGKYYERHSRGSNVVVLDPDVAKVFSNPELINRSLRSLAEIIKLHKKTSRAS